MNLKALKIDGFKDMYGTPAPHLVLVSKQLNRSKETLELTKDLEDVNFILKPKDIFTVECIGNFSKEDSNHLEVGNSVLLKSYFSGEGFVLDAETLILDNKNDMIFLFVHLSNIITTIVNVELATEVKQLNTYLGSDLLP
jgi:hypothetical protein